MTKTYILDTNVLLSDPSCLNNFKDNNLIIPMVVLEELDRHKSRSDEVGRNCREISRILDELTKKGSLKDGVMLPSGGMLRVLSDTEQKKSSKQDELNSTIVDNMIIDFAMNFGKSTSDNVILVSKDINVRVKCSSLGIHAQDYLSLRVTDNFDSLYSGVKVVTVSNETISRFYHGAELNIKEITQDTTFPNQLFVIKSVDTNFASALCRVSNDGKLLPLQKFDNIFGVKPRNKEQSFSLDLLMNPAVKLVTLTGRAGCGKTLLAIAAGLAQLDSIGTQPTYQKLIVSRPIHPVGKDIGFLPGTLAEKMEPWIAPVKDNLEFLLNSTAGKKFGKSRAKKNDENQSSFNEPYLDLMQQKGLIEIEAITYIRGRSIPNAFILIDEAQNLTIHELKTIITRAGENTKIVLTGDLEQIDNVHVDSFTNGLTHAIEKFKEFDISGHVTLLKGERSDLATLASKIL
jgi:PhoH-like ATPase